MPGFSVSPLRTFHKVPNGTPDAWLMRRRSAVLSGANSSRSSWDEGMLVCMVRNPTVFGKHLQAEYGKLVV